MHKTLWLLALPALFTTPAIAAPTPAKAKTTHPHLQNRSRRRPDVHCHQSLAKVTNPAPMPR